MAASADNGAMTVQAGLCRVPLGEAFSIRMPAAGMTVNGTKTRNAV